MKSSEDLGMSPQKMSWDKKIDGAKLTALFQKPRRDRGRVDANRKDKEYINAVREKHFPLVPLKNFSQIYKRKASKISVNEFLLGKRNQEAGEFCVLNIELYVSLHFLNLVYCSCV